jgi:hypothetical protein
MSLVAANNRDVEKKDRYIKFVIQNTRLRLIPLVLAAWKYSMIFEQELCQWLSIDKALKFFNILGFI